MAWGNEYSHSGRDWLYNDIAKEHPEIGCFLDLRTAFLNPKSSFQDDRNAIETGAIFPVLPWLTLWGCLGA
jgi:hypothetical protein